MMACRLLRWSQQGQREGASGAALGISQKSALHFTRTALHLTLPALVKPAPVVTLASPAHPHSANLHPNPTPQNSRASWFLDAQQTSIARAHSNRTAVEVLQITHMMKAKHISSLLRWPKRTVWLQQQSGWGHGVGGGALVRGISIVLQAGCGTQSEVQSMG